MNSLKLIYQVEIGFITIKCKYNSGAKNSETNKNIYYNRIIRNANKDIY